MTDNNISQFLIVCYDGRWTNEKASIVYGPPFQRFLLVRTGEVGPNGKASVACEVCGKKLADPSSLYRHRKIHSGDKPHKCPYCPR
jgi:uncharacterized Zn-finger protein